eukprot:2776726-Pyramimonas_sp.AAC.1
MAGFGAQVEDEGVRRSAQPDSQGAQASRKGGQAGGEAKVRRPGFELRAAFGVVCLKRSGLFLFGASVPAAVRQVFDFSKLFSTLNS